MSLQIHPGARADQKNHFKYLQQAGAAPLTLQKLIEAIREAKTKIREHPDTWSFIPGSKRVRRVQITSFRMQVVFRKVRNCLTHAFITEVGTDLLNEEGKDQIHAMLRKTSAHARRYLKALQKAHETVLREGIRTDYSIILAREDPEFDARIERSKIEQYLKELDSGDEPA
jgi:uncharacterized protein YqgV (UPF0045/DUF77 family)